MISFNLADYNMEKIKSESKLFNLKTKNSFRVFGLKNGLDNPPISLALLKSDSIPSVGPLLSFLKENGVSVESSRFDEVDSNNDEAGHEVEIGLRKDLREDPILAAAILQTIVYFIENRLSLRGSEKIHGIPKFS